MPGKTRISAKSLVEPRLFDALAIKGAITRFPPESLTVVQHKGTAGTGDYAGAKAGVRLGTNAEVERQARDGGIAEIEIAALVVAAKMAGCDKGNSAIFNFILIAHRSAERSNEVCGLSGYTRAIEFQERIVCELVRWSRKAVLACVGFGAA